MLREKMVEILKDLGFIGKRILKSRIIPFVIVAVGLFLVLLIRLFKLQIIDGDKYSNSYQLKAEKKITTPGVRANIYDRNGKILAYSDLAYSVVISDSGYYDSIKMKHAALNNIIDKMIDIIEQNNDSILYDFGINCDKKGKFYYTVEDNALLRFLRDIYGHAKISELSEEERTSSAETTAKYILNQYKIYTEETKANAIKSGADEKELNSIAAYSPRRAIQIAYIRCNLSANSYKRYVSFEVANNVNSRTMAAILENQDVLTGVTIEENTIRKYNDAEYISHIIGYTGKISSEQLDELSLVDSKYEANDVVGKAGIEEKYETVLSGSKGEKNVLVDNVGRIVEVVNETPAMVGKDVYLTIDIDIQKKVYELLERRIAETLVSYMTPSDDAYSESGYILVPVRDICFALINNNVIDINLMAEGKTESQEKAYSLFTRYKEEIVNRISADLKEDISLNSYDEDTQEYIRQIRKLLMNLDILNADKIDTNSDIHTSWGAGTISMREYLKAAIENQWINLQNLDIKSEYPSIEEVLNATIDIAIKEFSNSSEIDKLIYKYLVYNHLISYNDVCLILMDQDKIKYTESEYINIRNGGSTFDFLENKILNLEITPAQLALDPCSGSCVIENPNNGQIIAMVSYPGYDINKFSGTIDSEYYSKLLEDKSTPLVNRALNTRIAPGSTFKPLTSIAGLCEHVMGAYELIECDGVFDRLTPNVKCWCYPGRHGMLDVPGALMQSCNDYFCEIGYRLSITDSGKLSMDLGLSRLKYYAEQVGLATKTGIQLNESTPHPSDYNPTVSSIGQGTHAYTSLNLARYISTVANSGTVYNCSIVKSVESQDKSEVTIVEPEIANVMDIDPEIWNVVHDGMKRVIEDSAVKKLTNTLPDIIVHGKSGTAQEDKNRADHANFVMYATDLDGNPEVVVTTMMPYGHTASQASIMNYYALAVYYNQPIPSRAIYTKNYTIDVIQ